MGLFQKLFGMSGSPNLDLIKQLLRESSGAPDFIRRAEAEGFSLFQNAPTHIMYVKGECKFTVTGSDTVYTVSAFEKKGAGIVRLVDDGKLIFDAKKDAANRFACHRCTEQIELPDVDTSGTKLRVKCKSCDAVYLIRSIASCSASYGIKSTDGKQMAFLCDSDGTPY